MKFILVVYALIGILLQVLLGEVTGLGQGSIGILVFLFLVEIDSRFRFKYIIPNIKESHQERVEKGKHYE